MMMRSSERHARDYDPYDHLAGHLKGAKAHRRLFELIEERAFLVTQARHADGFQLGSRDVEENVLEAAIEEQDWRRFLRYSSVALHFREIATALAEEPILRSLVRLGHHQLARNLAGQLPDPQARARARSVILAAAGDPGNEEDLRLLLEDLGSVPVPETSGEAERWLATLLALARLPGPERLRGRWPRWIAHLETAGATPEETEESHRRIRQVWTAVAETWLAHDVGERSGLWEALAAMADPDEVLRFLPRRLAKSPACDESFLERPLPPPFEDDERLLAHVHVAILARRARSDPAACEESWTRLSHLRSSWSAELVDAGRELWPRLPPERLRRLASSIDDPVTRAALWVVTLEEGPRTDLDPAVLEALEEIPKVAARLHWTLRHLATRPSSPEKRRLLRRVVYHLEDLRYDADAADLARCFDLVAAELGESEVRRQLEGFVASPTSSPEKLRELAAEAKDERVLEALLARAEEYAAAITRTPSEGFGMRCELLIRAGSRLCARAGDVSILRRVAGWLLPEEEDRLRSATVDALLATHRADPQQTPSYPDLALRVARAIRSPRLRLLARLRAATDSEALARWLPQDQLPGRLYAAVVNTAAVEDERLALAPLHEMPIDPGALAREHVGRIRDPDRRIQALIDLARHALAFQERVYPRRRDPAAALQPLALAAGGTSSDERLLLLTPELVAVGSKAGPRRALAELREATLRILRLDTVSPARRCEVLAALIARLGPMVLGDQDPPQASRCRAVAELLRWIVRLPARREHAGESMRELWAGLLPILLAAPEHLPPLCRAYVLHPLRTRVCVDWFPTVTRILGLERFWGLLGRLQGLLPRWAVGRTSWRAGAEAFYTVSLPAQRPVLEAFFDEDPQALRRYGEAVPERARPEPQELETLACLLCGRAPELVPRLLGRLPPGPARDTLCLWLVRHRWLRGEQAQEAAALCTEEATALRAELWRAWTAGNKNWVESLAALLVQHDFDPLDPRHAPLRRALRQGDCDGDLVALAGATRASLIRGGRSPGEQALRWWLDVFLGRDPKPGSRPFEEAAAAIREAASL